MSDIMRKGSHQTPEARAKIAKGHLGIEPWNKNKKGLQEAWNKNIPQSPEAKKKNAEKHLGRKAWNEGLTKETDPRVAAYAEKDRIAHMGKPSPQKGKTLEKIYGEEKAKEIRAKESQSAKERPPNRLGTTQTEKDPVTKEAIEKMRIAGEKHWLDEEYKNKQKAALKKKPNEEEKILDGVIQTITPNTFKYVGDFSFWIGRKNPDWICTINGIKALIEYNGYAPSHTPEKDAIKTKYYHGFKYNVLNIYRKELNKKNRTELSIKIKEFVDKINNKNGVLV
jgi:very-short-patch-repair endonuclease